MLHLCLRFHRGGPPLVFLKRRYHFPVLCLERYFGQDYRFKLCHAPNLYVTECFFFHLTGLELHGCYDGSSWSKLVYLSAQQLASEHAVSPGCNECELTVPQCISLGIVPAFASISFASHQSICSHPLLTTICSPFSHHTICSKSAFHQSICFSSVHLLLTSPPFLQCICFLNAVSWSSNMLSRWRR